MIFQTEFQTNNQGRFIDTGHDYHLIAIHEDATALSESRTEQWRCECGACIHETRTTVYCVSETRELRATDSDGRGVYAETKTSYNGLEGEHHGR